LKARVLLYNSSKPVVQENLKSSLAAPTPLTNPRKKRYMFLSYLKSKPNATRPAGSNSPPRENRAGEKQANRHDENARQAHPNNSRGAIGALAAIAILMWFIAFFLLAGPGIGVSGNSGANPDLRSAVNVSANSH
jgi:hypothetical protein